METNNYYIHICSSIERRSVDLRNTTLDEAVSVGIVFFDKFATKIGDSVIIAKSIENKLNPTFSEQILVRQITLKEGLKVEVEVL